MKTLNDMSDAQLCAHMGELIADVRNDIERLKSSLGMVAHAAKLCSLGMEASAQLRIVEGYHPRSPHESVSADRLEEAVKWLPEEMRGAESVEPKKTTLRRLVFVDEVQK